MNEPFHCAHRFQDNNGIKSPRVIMAAIVIFFFGGESLENTPRHRT
jgi:hypothetical protein